MAYTFKHGDRPLDDYTIQRAVGRGGFGEVYYAISDGGREVALKYLKENPHVELRGVSHCINLKSPHLVSIFDVKKSAEGEYFIIMEYISGPSLRDLLIAEPKGFTPEKAAFFAREIGKGLAYLHDRGIVHRDLKPGNIFFDDGYVKIGDYGLSKFISVSRHSVQTSSVGTVHYMAPEIGSGNYSRGVDIYALGVMLYEMLCGRVPFEGSTMAEVLMKHLTSQPELDQLPHAFGQVIRRALQKDPKDRYATVEEMMDELLTGEEIQRSLAGFSPQSLTDAVRHHVQERLDSPLPSPNPRREGAGAAVPQMKTGAAGGFGGLQGPPLPEKIAKKYEQIARKIDKKMTKLGRRAEKLGLGPPRQRGGDARHAHGGGDGDGALVNLSLGKRMLLIGMLLAGCSVGLAMIALSTFKRFHEEFAGTAGMLVPMLYFSVLLGRQAVRWFTVDYGPTWAQHMIHACCAAPLLAMACIPLFDLASRGDGTPNYGLPLWLGLLGLAAFADWDSEKARGENDISGGQIFGKALGALILTAIVQGIFGWRTEKLMWLAAGVGGAVSFVYQAGGAWGVYQRRRLEEFGRDARTIAPVPTPPMQRRLEETLPTATIRQEGTRPQENEPGSGRRTLPPSVPPSWHPGMPIVEAPRARWIVARMFWCLVAFLWAGGAIVTFVYSLVSSGEDYHSLTAAIIFCTGFAAFTIFALSKTTPHRRVGFWRETVRPFFISACLFGIGSTTTAIAREWNHLPQCADLEEEADELPADGFVRTRVATRLGVKVAEMRADLLGRQLDDCEHAGAPCLDEEGKAAMVTLLVLSSLGLIMATFLTGKRSRQSRSFLNQPGSVTETTSVETTKV